MAASAAAGRDEASPSPAPEQVAVLAQFVAKPGRESEVCDALLHLVEPSRAESGNVSYDLHRLKNNPAAFYILANWTDQAALDQHMASAHVRALLDERVIPELLARPMLSCARLLSSPDTRPDRPRATAGSPAQVTLVPFFTIKPGEVDAVRRAHLAMVEPTRGEPGCLAYDLYQSREDPSVMFFYENWTNQDALSKHMNTPNFYRYVRGEVDGRLVVPWTAHMMAMISQPSR
ncbi:putative quinol monooxygenase [Micromonospora sp. AMSO31t]|uniref:putative quinol monooxygenase n=1 Tax=Micromonospora sp. AMSO31t TaxID=2650566 RepID=UPI001788CA6A|nr:putative quinol monooxygenase [Micromonospora sp. AMSO31t]